MSSMRSADAEPRLAERVDQPLVVAGQRLGLHRSCHPSAPETKEYHDEVARFFDAHLGT